MILDERLPLIVRIPFENAIPVSSSIMSDAATLTFLRDILNLKVPNVIAYSEHNTPQHNPVGREFLIYEHVPGLSLQSIWTSISGRQVASLITQIFSQTEAVPGAVPFSQSGSLYFTDDVSLELYRDCYAVVDGSSRDRVDLNSLIYLCTSSKGVVLPFI